MIDLHLLAHLLNVNAAERFSSAAFFMRKYKTVKFGHSSILCGSLKACPERSRMGAAWGWQSSKSGVTIPKNVFLLSMSNLIILIHKRETPPS